MKSINRATAAQPASPRLSAVQPVPFTSIGKGIGMQWNEQYLQPEWQKTRFRKITETGFCCERCGASDEQIHIHHRQYFKGRKVWEYENHELETLCATCHEVATSEMAQLKVILSRIPTECLPDIQAMVMGYIIHGSGPIHSTKIDDLPDYTPEPYFGGIGRLAAASAVLPRAYLIHDLCEQVEAARYGGTIQMAIPASKSLKSGF